MPLHAATRRRHCLPERLMLSLLARKVGCDADLLVLPMQLEKAEEGLKDKAVPSEAFTYVNGKRNYKHIDHNDLFPYLLVNIGSGVSMIKVDGDGKFERVSGTSIGLTSTTIASSFGKAVSEVKELEEYKPEDVVRCILRMISNNIGQVEYLNALRFGLKKILFGGFFIGGHAYTMDTISMAVEFWLLIFSLSFEVGFGRDDIGFMLGWWVVWVEVRFRVVGGVEGCFEVSGGYGIPAINALKNANSGVELKDLSMPIDLSQPVKGIIENLLMWARNRKNNSATFHCTVTIDGVRTKKGWNFPSCESEDDKKGVTDKKVISFVKRATGGYRLKLDVSNDNAQNMVVMFDETTTALVGCSAGSLMDIEDELYDHVSLPPAISNLIGTTHVLEIKPHTYYEYETCESFTCWQINPAKGGKDSVGSSTLDVVADVQTLKLKRLVRAPSVATPSKPSEAIKNKILVIEDSDTEASGDSSKRVRKNKADSPPDNKKRKWLLELPYGKSISVKHAPHIYINYFQYSCWSGWKSPQLLWSKAGRYTYNRLRLVLPLDMAMCSLYVIIMCAKWFNDNGKEWRIACNATSIFGLLWIKRLRKMCHIEGELSE
ncbi:pantothenate kinase 1 [Tanacetum coccineum]